MPRRKRGAGAPVSEDLLQIIHLHPDYGRPAGAVSFRSASWGKSVLLDVPEWVPVVPGVDDPVAVTVAAARCVANHNNAEDGVTVLKALGLMPPSYVLGSARDAPFELDEPTVDGQRTVNEPAGPPAADEQTPPVADDGGEQCFEDATPFREADLGGGPWPDEPAEAAPPVVEVEVPAPVEPSADAPEPAVESTDAATPQPKPPRQRKRGRRWVHVVFRLWATTPDGTRIPSEILGAYANAKIAQSLLGDLNDPTLYVETYPIEHEYLQKEIVG